jgi:two-component system, NtrC family, sensor histidine kinase HydH
MFRVKASAGIERYELASRVVQSTLVLALLANCSLTYLIYRDLLSWRTTAGPALVSSLESSSRRDALQLALNLLVSTILVISLVALWWLRRRYASSQDSLRRVKMLAHDILASMDRGVVTTNREGIITSINSASILLLQVDFECVGRPLAAISTADVPLVDVHRDVVELCSAVLDRDFSVNRAGHVLRLRVDGQVLRDTEGGALGSVIHLRDVTERMLLEERMRRMERFLSLATLASGLHHEIKNPLTALSIHIQLLEEHLADGRPVDELVGVLKTEVCRLNGVLESFRSFAHLQHLSLEPTDALEVVENAIRLMRPQAAEQGVLISLAHPEEEFPLVSLDADRFEQAVLNLLINALEAMPEGGVLTVSAAVHEGEFRVSVQDSGPGIPPEVQKKLFLPYFSTKTEGSGLGLALSEKLIGQHGGRIDFRTGPAGTTFDITVPLQPRSETA